MNTIRIRRHDWPAIAACIIILGLIIAASARAQTVPPIVETVAKEAAQQVAAPGWLSLAGNLTVAGILWYYSRRFYDDKKATDDKVLQLTERCITAMVSLDNSMRELRTQVHDDHRARSQQIKSV